MRLSNISQTRALGLSDIYPVWSLHVVLHHTKRELLLVSSTLRIQRCGMWCLRLQRAACLCQCCSTFLFFFNWEEKRPVSFVQLPRRFPPPPPQLPHKQTDHCGLCSGGLLPLTSPCH